MPRLALLVCLLGGAGCSLLVSPLEQVGANPDAAVAERVSDGVQVLYRFDDGLGIEVRDQSGVEPAIDLSIEDETRVSWGDGYLRIVRDTMIFSPSPATRLNQTCAMANEITVEAWITPASDMASSMTPPDRIVSLSESSSVRNIALGVGGAVGLNGRPDVFSLRLQTSTGSHSLDTGAGTVKAELTHLVATSGAGNLLVYLDGVVFASGSYTGGFSEWQDYRLALANEFGTMRPYIGDYHLVAIYCRALTAEEVNRNFQAGPGD